MDYQSNRLEKIVPGLAVSIIKTLIYFKVRRIEPSLVKIQRLLINLRDSNDFSSSLFKVRKTLDWLKQEKVVLEKRGFYKWLSDESADKNFFSIKREKIVAEKMKIAVREAKILKLLPCLQFIGICGTVATGNPRKESDIDLLIVAKKNRIWLTRLGALFLLEISGRRRKKNKDADRICLNYFITEDNLNLKFKDLYTALELASMICLLDRNRMLEKLKLANLWVEKYLPNSKWRDLSIPNYWERKVTKEKKYQLEKKKKYNLFFLKPIVFLLVKIIDFLEISARFFQEKRIKRKRKEEKGGQVYWGNDALIFHPKPKGIFFKNEYKKFLMRQEKTIKNLLGNLGSSGC